MKDVTITLFVEPSQLKTFLLVLRMLEDLELENDYVFDPKDITYTEVLVSAYNQVNLPVDLYLKFIYSYNKLLKAKYYQTK